MQYTLWRRDDDENLLADGVKIWVSQMRRNAYYLEVWDGEVDDNLEEWVDCDCGEEMDLMEQKTIKTITD